MGVPALSSLLDGLVTLLGGCNTIVPDGATEAGGICRVPVFASRQRRQQVLTGVQPAEEGKTVLYSDDPENGAPVSHDDLIVVNVRTSRFHLPSCKWAQEMSPRNARYYLTVNDARSAGCFRCNTCDPSRHHDEVLSGYSNDQLLTAYRQQGLFIVADLGDDTG